MATHSHWYSLTTIKKTIDAKRAEQGIKLDPRNYLQYEKEKAKKTKDKWNW